MKRIPVLPRRASAGLALLLAASAPFAAAQTWNFDTDAQGWIVHDLAGVGDYVTSFGTYAVDWNAAGGNPGGYISRIDPTSNTYFFEAPTAALGDYSAFVGGQLSFSLQSTMNTWTTDNVVVFRGGAGNLTLVAAINPIPAPTWGTYTLGLTADQFRYNNLGGGVVSTTDFAAVLGNLQAFRISAEYGNVVAEISGLDSVSFAAIPEPATTTLALGAAVGAFALWRRRRAAR